MTLPNSTENSGAGNPLQTHIPGGTTREFPVVMSAGSDGHVIGSRPDFIFDSAPAANAAGRTLMDLFNTGTAPIRIRGIWLKPTMTAITGAPISWLIQRTTTIGGGGTALAAGVLDSAGSAWPAAATARSNPTSGAAGTTLMEIFALNEETNAAFGMLPLVNLMPQLGDRVTELVLRANEGFAVKQSAVANAVGLTGVTVLATFDN